MRTGIFRIAALTVGLVLFAAPALAQTPSPESKAAAKEMVTVMNIPDQFKAILPTLITHMKPAIVQGRANVERDFDAIVPFMLEAFQTQMNDMVDGVALVYASNFSAEELRALTAFYKSPAGQKFLQKSPAIFQQTMAIGQQFGRLAGAEVQTRMREELRKKGHDL